jgi:hypothetical protein
MSDQLGGNYLTLADARKRQEEGLQAARESIPESERDEVPERVNAVKAWVGRDADRAQRALDAEAARADGERESLVEWLQKVTE